MTALEAVISEHRLIAVVVAFPVCIVDGHLPCKHLTRTGWALCLDRPVTPNTQKPLGLWLQHMLHVTLQCVACKSQMHQKTTVFHLETSACTLLFPH